MIEGGIREGWVQIQGTYRALDQHEVPFGVMIRKHGSVDSSGVLLGTMLYGGHLDLDWI